MAQKLTAKHVLTVFFLVLIPSVFVPNVYAWGNGGYSDDPFNPDYGTHDWIAEHAKNWLPIGERKWIDDNLNYFLYGTEYPDNSGASYGTTSGYGDTAKHHNYYDSSGSVTDASAAIRAKSEYDKALAELKAGRNVTAAIYAGSMTHYIDDVTVFGHVMTGETHHNDYEDYVGTRTARYSYGVFESYLVFDGNLENISAYDASIILGRNTFNDDGGTYTADWMDTHYDWSNSAFKNRCGKSLNLAANYVTDILHTLVVAAFGTNITTTKSSSQISCSVSSTSISIASSVTVSGAITPARSGITVTVSYTLPNSTILMRTVTAGSDGKYSDIYTPIVLGSWSVKASWDGDSTYAGAASTSISFTVSRISSTISCSVSSSNISIGNSITASGLITPTFSGVTITLSYTLPNSSIIEKTTTSNSSGGYSDTYIPSIAGSWSVKASWKGDATHEGASSSSKPFTVSKISTTISCSVSSSNITVGDFIIISGSISPARSGVSVTISYIYPQGSGLVTVTSASDSSYSYSWKPAAVGFTYQVKASWEGDGSYSGATSSVVSVTVSKISTIISCKASSSEITEGDTITVTGSIIPSVSEKTVTLTYTKPDGKTTVKRTVTTGSDGSYSDSYKPDVVGSWSVSASWIGDSTYDGASSSSQAFTVKKKSGCLIATATYGSELSPEVQFLRDFRDNIVLKTFVGSQFMSVFNGIYYSFSPTVASGISSNEVFRGLMKIVLYPLMGILHLGVDVYSLFSFSPDLGILVFCLVVSSLMSIVYLVPWALLYSSLKKKAISIQRIRIVSLIWAGSIATILIAELAKSSLLMMASGGLFVLSTACLTTLTMVNAIIKRYIRETY